MINGLTPAEFHFLREKLILPLQQKGFKVFLFGSRANGKYKKFSDIDLFYVSDKNITEPKGFIYSLLRDLEDSSFPYKVDLAHYPDLAEGYLNSIDQEKIEL